MSTRIRPLHVRMIPWATFVTVTVVGVFLNLPDVVLYLDFAFAAGAIAQTLADDVYRVLVGRRIRIFFWTNTHEHYVRVYDLEQPIGDLYFNPAISQIQIHEAD